MRWRWQWQREVTSSQETNLEDQACEGASEARFFGKTEEDAANAGQKETIKEEVEQEGTG